jgi:tetratricopeptide (TPR) repeat protein
MNVQELMRSHRYADAIADLRRDLANNPDDMLAVAWMAEALRANGEYEEALPFFKRLEAHRKEDKVANALAPGSAPYQIDIACLHWLFEDHVTAIRLKRDLAVGIIDGSINYGDAAGGMSQGLLLYYMAITDNSSEEVSFALDYMRNRVKRLKRSYSTNVWPCPIAQYYLGDVTFETVMDEVNRQPTLVGLSAAKLELGRGRRLCVALFHDGIQFRTQDDDGNSFARMRECYALENPLIEQERYLARYEVQKADNR